MSDRDKEAQAEALERVLVLNLGKAYDECA
jgi:hypothetical protein